MRRINLLDSVAIFMCFFFMFYVLAGMIEHRSPNVSIKFFIGIMIALVCCAAVFLIHGIISSKQSAENEKGKISKKKMILAILLTIVLLYLLSSKTYLGVGETIGRIIGALVGFYLFSLMKINFPYTVRQYLAAILIGVCLFFVLRDTCLDTLTMASYSLSPRIEKGEKVLVNKLAFGLRIPFFYKNYILKWRDPSKGDLIIFLPKETNNLKCREFVGSEGNNIIVKDNRKTETLEVKSIIGSVVVFTSLQK